MKTSGLIILIVIASHFSVNAQRTVGVTDTLKVTGRIKASRTFTVADLEAFEKVDIKDQVIYNQKGEAKDTIDKIKGVPLKKVLESIEFVYEKPRELNAFCFIFTASDGYKVVISWNEIYNTELGDGFFFVTEMEGKKLKDMDRRILFMSTKDLKSGRRFIKGLKTIEVRKIE